jgi:hypothetical protein
MPDTLVDTDILRAAVQLARRAPSLHNSQPWQWVAEGSRLLLDVDRSRILSSADKSGREALDVYAGLFDTDPDAVAPPAELSWQDTMVVKA